MRAASPQTRTKPARKLPWGGPPELGVPIRIEDEPIGTLFVDGPPSRTFTDNDRRLLQTLADQASVALGWPRLLLRAINDIERESARLFDQDKEIESAIREIKDLGRPPFDFAALQVIRPGEQVIETVRGVQVIRPGERVIETLRGVGRAAEWEGRAKHYLEQRRKLRDIQADIAMSKPPRIEIITRKDPRFDRWIFKTFKHEKFVRAFIPLILARDADGKVLEGDALDEWLGMWETGDSREVVQCKGKGRRQVIPL